MGLTLGLYVTLVGFALSGLGLMLALVQPAARVPGALGQEQPRDWVDQWGLDGQSVQRSDELRRELLKLGQELEQLGADVAEGYRWARIGLAFGSVGLLVAVAGTVAAAAGL